MLWKNASKLLDAWRISFNRWPVKKDVFNVFPHGQVRQKSAILEDIGHFFRFIHLPVAIGDTGKDIEYRGFTASRRAEYAVDFAFLKLQAKAI